MWLGICHSLPIFLPLNKISHKLLHKFLMKFEERFALILASAEMLRCSLKVMYYLALLQLLPKQLSRSSWFLREGDLLGFSYRMREGGLVSRK